MATLGSVTITGVQGGSVTTQALSCTPIVFEGRGAAHQVIGSPYIVWQEAAMLPGTGTLELNVPDENVYDGLRTACRPRGTVTISSDNCPGLWISGKVGVLRLSFSQWSPAHRQRKASLEFQILSDPA